MGNGLTRVVLWALAFLVLANVLASIPGAQAGSTPNYTLLGYVTQAGGASAPPVPSGVTVDLISSASSQTYTTTTQSAGGSFSFNAANTGSTLAPGWWGVWVPPQAHASVYGCKPCAVLPSEQNPQYYWENSTSLTTQTTADNPVSVSGVTLTPYNATIWGNATFLGAPVAGASVQLLDPTFNGLVLANNTTVSQATNTTVVGEFSLIVPFGTWVLQTTVAGSPNYYSTQLITVSADQMTVNPAVQKNFYAWGYIDQKSDPTARVPASGNATVFDPTTGYVYTSPISSGYYSLATYPAGFTGPGAQTLDVVLAPVGWQTVTYALSVSTATPGGPGAHLSYTSPIAPPASYNTTLNFSAGFGKVSVTTAATLHNDSTFPNLANASVGQLWAQLALDWQNNLSFNEANLATVLAWVNSSGPFFAAGQSLLTVNGTGFGQPANDTFSGTSTCVSFCNLTSGASIQLNWAQSYNVTASLPANPKTWALSFVFKHPTNYGAYNYTVVLPTGWVLTAGNQVPAQSRLVPAGPDNTWTSFKLVSGPSSSPSSTATFTIVKYSAVTAVVNVTTSNFAFSTADVLNETHNNYTVVVGVGQNATFSALNSSFPSGNNGTLYQWAFGDGNTTSTSLATTYHTYTAAGEFKGTLTLTSSGGQMNTVDFFVYTDDLAPTALISANATVEMTGGGAEYLLINSSTTLHFNASSSTAQINSATTLPGVLSIASWNISTGTSAVTLANYSTGSGLKFASNLTVQFNGAGSYLTSGNVNGTAVAFTGWQYNVTLQVWDGAGHRSVAYLDVLVRDKQKPVPVIDILNSAGASIVSSGIVEGANQTAEIVLNGANSTDPHNGSVATYNWVITNSGNSSVSITNVQQAVQPGYKVPAKPRYWLQPQDKPYTVNLTVTDRANNTAYTTASLTISINTSERPVLSVTNLTAPTTMTDGSSYTVWANVTNTIGQNSTALNVSVRFYLLPPSGVGSGTTIGGSPASVKFYNYTAGILSGTPVATGLIDIPWNETVRAEISFTPSSSGTFDLWANASAQNEFISDYKIGANQQSVSVTLNPNPDIEYEEIAGVAVVIVVLIVVFLVLRNRGPRVGSKGGSKSSGGSKPSADKSKKDADDDDE
jgi:hypothetical protein